jgi:hypothetical protein
MLPQGYRNFQTAHRRFQQWCEQEVLREVLTDLAKRIARERRDRTGGLYQCDDCFGKGGGEDIGSTKRGKGVRIMRNVDRRGWRLAVSTHAANFHEVTLVQLSIDFSMIEAKP